MNKEEYDERFAEIIVYCMTLCYAIEDFTDYSPHFVKEVKKTGKVFLEKLLIVRDLYFGTKTAKRIYGNEEATESSQEYMWENVKLIEEYYKIFLTMTEEKHKKIREILYNN
jgi:hypothetical protein